MDPHQNRFSSGNPDHTGSAEVPGNDQSPAATDRTRPPADRQPQHSGGFTVIPPNESRWTQIRMMAQKEEEERQRWKEMHRVTSVHVDPERLGGIATMAEARDKQMANLRGSKLQKKLQRDEQEKRRKREEEEKLQRMKAEQRQKAERLEERRQQEEQRRTEQLGPDRLRKTESLLHSLESRAAGALASCTAPRTSSRREAAESKRRDEAEKSKRDVELEHKKDQRSLVESLSTKWLVNAAFLDKLEARGGGSGTSAPEAARPSPAAEPVRPAHVSPDPGQSCSARTPAADQEADWALMELASRFPHCDRVFLQEVLSQCGGDCQQAYALLWG